VPLNHELEAAAAVERREAETTARAAALERRAAALEQEKLRRLAADAAEAASQLRGPRVPSARGYLHAALRALVGDPDRIEFIIAACEEPECYVQFALHQTGGLYAEAVRRWYLSRPDITLTQDSALIEMGWQRPPDGEANWSAIFDISANASFERAIDVLHNTLVHVYKASGDLVLSSGVSATELMRQMSR
jgi:hypothetical protein